MRNTRTRLPTRQRHLFKIEVVNVMDTLDIVVVSVPSVCFAAYIVLSSHRSYGLSSETGLGTDVSASTESSKSSVLETGLSA